MRPISYEEQVVINVIMIAAIICVAINTSPWCMALVLFFRPVATLAIVIGTIFGYRFE